MLNVKRWMVARNPRKTEKFETVGTMTEGTSSVKSPLEPGNYEYKVVPIYWVV